MTEAVAVGSFSEWEREVSAASGCSHPIRLSGRITAVDRASGESAEIFKTWTDVTAPNGDIWRDDQPLYVDCGNRREEFCPHCSKVYKRDARNVVLSGLRGGKGVPESVAEHPCVFATFTAPSFGPVHARRLDRNGKVLPCRPRRDASKRVCPHGRDVSCPGRHCPEDPRLGRPMCADCYDYDGAVLFNAGAADVWRRFTTYLPRHLARVAGIRVGECRELVRPRYIKVYEYQARGVIHYHAVIRLDANVEDENAFVHPGPLWTAELLAKAIPLAAAQASAWCQAPDDDRPVLVRFGPQTDVRVIRSGTQHAVSREAVANYIAKYITKSVGIPGLPKSRINHVTEIGALRCSAHHKQMIGTAWNLGFRRHAHEFGYGGHPLTKSRRYSVTFGYIRRERAEYRKARRWPGGEMDPWGRPLDERVVLVLKDFSFVGTGYLESDAHSLALMSADNARNDLARFT